MITQKTIVAIDVDGVIADFYLGMCKKFNKKQENLYNWDVEWLNKHFNEIINDHSFWENLPILNHPEAITFNISYYISAFPIEMMEARQNWLNKHSFPKGILMHSDNKVEMLKDLGVDLFVDDKHSTVIECNNSGIKCLKYIPKYMFEPKTKYDIKNLNEVNNHIEYN